MKGHTQIRRHLGLGLALLTIVVGGVLGARSQQLPTIQVDYPKEIHAGDSFRLTVEIPDAQAGEKLQVSLFNGLQRLDQTLTLGSGGIALWNLMEGKITQAGQSLIALRYANLIKQYPLVVLPLPAEKLTLITTSYTILAYGRGRTMVISLAEDLWGNAPIGTPSLQARFVEADLVPLQMKSIDGIAWLSLDSRDNPGRVRLSAQLDGKATAIELTQYPSAPDRITLQLSPDCVLNDGRDVIQLIAQVADQHGSPVVDGTLVIFSWDDGEAYAQTIHGQAMIHFPAPTQLGVHSFMAGSGNAKTQPVALRVTSEVCP